MTKTAKTAKKRIGRPEGRKPLLNLRIEQDLLDKLKDAAAAHPGGRTVAEETVSRLRRSFREDQVIGGPEVADLAHTMTALFAFCAKRAAVAAGHPDWSAKQWLADQVCYQAGTEEVCRTLIMGMPRPSAENVAETLDCLRRQLAIALSHKGEISGGSGFIAQKDDQQ